jgi:homospermidine synthase
MESSKEYKNYGHIDDICLLGHGSIGRGVLPLIKRHFTFNNLTIVDPSPVHEPKTGPNIKYVKIALTKHNFREQLNNIFDNAGKVKFCINLTVDVSSV